MSFLDRMIGRYEPPSRERWADIALTISKGLEPIRRDCYVGCQDALRESFYGESPAEEMKAVDQIIDVMEQRFREEVELRKRSETQEETT